MGNVKGKNKETNDTTKNEPIKAGSTHQDDTGGIFNRKFVMIMKLIKELLSKKKSQEESE